MGNRETESPKELIKHYKEKAREIEMDGMDK